MGQKQFFFLSLPVEKEIITNMRKKNAKIRNFEIGENYLMKLL